LSALATDERKELVGSRDCRDGRRDARSIDSDRFLPFHRSASLLYRLSDDYTFAGNNSGCAPDPELRIRLIGDISYSTYLIHFPVTLLLVLLNKTGWTNLNFNLRSTWILYFTIVLAVAVPTHYWFERPAQRFLRRQMLRGRSPHGRSLIGLAASDESHHVPVARLIWRVRRNLW
jgi:hypothetical protein